MQSYEAMNRSIWTRKFQRLRKKNHQIGFRWHANRGGGACTPASRWWPGPMRRRPDPGRGGEIRRRGGRIRRRARRGDEGVHGGDAGRGRHPAVAAGGAVAGGGEDGERARWRRFGGGAPGRGGRRARAWGGQLRAPASPRWLATWWRQVAAPLWPRAAAAACPTGSDMSGVVRADF